MEPINETQVSIDNQFACFMDKHILPNELIEIIFKTFDNIDIQQLSCVSKSWNVMTLERAKIRDFNSLESFIGLMTKGLDGYERFANFQLQINDAHFKINQIAHESTIVKASNLRQIKSSFDESKQKIIFAIKSFSLFFFNCKNINHPLSYLLTISKVHQQIENVSTKGIDIESYYYNKQIDSLIIYNEYSKSIEVLDKMELYSFKSDSALAITTSIVKKYKIQYTFELIKKLLIMLNNENPHNNLGPLAICLNTLMTNRFFDEAILFAEEKPNFANEYPDFGNILGLILKYNLSSINEIAYEMPAPLLYDISQTLFQDGKKKEAILVANRISDPELKKTALSDIKNSSCILM